MCQDVFRRNWTAQSINKFVISHSVARQIESTHTALNVLHILLNLRERPRFKCVRLKLLKGRADTTSIAKEFQLVGPETLKAGNLETALTVDWWQKGDFTGW